MVVWPVCGVMEGETSIDQDKTARSPIDGDPDTAATVGLAWQAQAQNAEWAI